MASMPRIQNSVIRIGTKALHLNKHEYASIGLEQSMRVFLLATLGLILIANCVRAAASNGPNALHEDNQWLKEHLLNVTAQPPFSFAFDRQGSSALLKAWPKRTETRRLDGVRTEHSVIWNDPKTGLQVRLEALEFANSPVVEWTAYFKNESEADSPILEYVQALDVSFRVAGKGIPTILYSKGCGVMDTYSLQKKPLNQLESFQLSSESGGKTVETIPFFDVVTAGHGLIGALGWPGKWAINFSRSTEAAIAVSAGMETTHLSLHPGEEIRTPEILLLPWVGDDIDAHNVLRRHILKYHTPQYDGKPVVLPVSHLGWGGMKTSTSLRLIEQISKENIGFENFWMDAGWYGADRPVDEFQVFGKEDWFLHAGNWRVNEVPHPDGLGLRPISDAAHAHGMKFLLWFEPERAVVGTPLTIQHPDWFVGEVTTNFEGNTERPLVKFRMFDFGNPKARQFMIDSMSDLITKEGIDVYRQDCNFALAPFWAQADAKDRQGITQIRYAEGLLTFWDELRRRHPQLILDIVQRGDLETISRAVDLSRADYPVSPDADPIGAQVSTEGLAYWRPHFGTLSGRATPIISAAGWRRVWLSRSSMSRATRTRSVILYLLIFPMNGCATWSRSLRSSGLITTATTIRSCPVVKIPIALPIRARSAAPHSSGLPGSSIVPNKEMECCRPFAETRASRLRRSYVCGGLIRRQIMR